MAVLRLRDGSLLVHSPVALDEALAGALARLGPIRHIVSPNYEHVKHAAQARAPRAQRVAGRRAPSPRGELLGAWDACAARTAASLSSSWGLIHRCRDAIILVVLVHPLWQAVLVHRPATASGRGVNHGRGHV